MGKISMKGRVPTLYLGPQRIFISEGCTQASPLTTDVKWLCVIIVPLRFGCVFLKHSCTVTFLWLERILQVTQYSFDLKSEFPFPIWCLFLNISGKLTIFQSS